MAVLTMAFLLQHTRLGFCWLDLIALAVLLVVIGVFVWQHRKLKKQEKELQDRLSAVYADKTVEAEQK